MSRQSDLILHQNNNQLPGTFTEGLSLMYTKAGECPEMSQRFQELPDLGENFVFDLNWFPLTPVSCFEQSTLSSSKKTHRLIEGSAPRKMIGLFVTLLRVNMAGATSSS